MRILKITLWILFALLALLLYWFLPKYSFISKNPQYCVHVTAHFYYCGSHSNIDSFYGLSGK